MRVTVSGSLGKPLCVQIVDGEGRVGEASSSAPLEEARSSPLTAESVKSAVGALGGDGLVLDGYDDSGLDLVGSPCFLPARALKEARREAVGQLLDARRAHGRAEGMAEEEMLPSLLKTTQEQTEAAVDSEPMQDTAIEMTVLCRSPAQVAAALEVEGVTEIAVDFLEVHGLQKAVESIKEKGIKCVVATPRILKPDEERLWKFYLRLGADALLIRSIGLLHKLMSFGGAGSVVETGNKAVGDLIVPELHGDFSLNAVNAISAGSFLANGLSRLTPGHDLSGKQIANLAKALGPQAASKLEVIAHMHLPVFHTEHCVFCRFLSEGDNYTNCGHPCESNQVHLRDQAGKDHLVLADMGCRNTVFNAQAQSAVNLMPRLLSSGIRRFRLELVDEPAEAVAPLLEAYREVAAEPNRAREVWKWLQTVPDANGNAQGVTLGSLRDKAEANREDLKLTKTRKKEQQQQQAQQQQQRTPQAHKRAPSRKQLERGRGRGRAKAKVR